MLTEDLYRKYLDKAYREACRYKSVQTNYLHFHPDSLEGELAQACPTEENFLFALLLLRKKTHESVQEARDRFVALLSFQNKDPSLAQHGNFPIHLTGLPHCQDWVLPLRIAVIISTTLKYFRQILGHELEQKFAECLRMLFDVLAENMTKIRFPRWAKIVHSILLEKDPGEIAEAVEAFFSFPELLSSDACGRVVAACALCSNDVYSCAVRKGSLFWNGRFYVGPPWGVFSYQSSPEVTLFDLVMSLHSNWSLVARPWSFSTSLACALIPPDHFNCDILQRSISLHSGSVRMWSDKGVFFSAVLCPPKPLGLHGFYPIRVVTSRATMVFHTPGGQLLDVVITDREVVFIVMLEQVSDDDPSILRFWIDRQKEVSLRLDGLTGSVFDPQKGLHITDGDVSFLLTIQSPLTTLGRINVGNRPSQVCRHRKGCQEAYDWKVSAEYVRGKYPVQFKMHLVQLP